MKFGFFPASTTIKLFFIPPQLSTQSSALSERCIFAFMPIRSEIEKELAERLVNGHDLNNTAFLVGHDINEIKHNDGRPLSLIEKIEVADAIRTRLIDGSAFKNSSGSIGTLSKICHTAIARQQVLETIEYTMQMVLHQLQ